jgi:translation initiation factor IF-1
MPQGGKQSVAKNTADSGIVLEGKIVDCLKNHTFRINVEHNGGIHQVLGHVGIKMRFASPRLLPGDKVLVKVSQYDLSRGEITARMETPYQGTGPDSPGSSGPMGKQVFLSASPTAKPVSFTSSLTGAEPVVVLGSATEGATPVYESNSPTATRVYRTN